MLERLDELFLDDGGRAAADVHGMEVIAEGLDVVHFLAKIHEVRARHMLLEEEAVEGAVRAQGVAERNVCVQQVLVSVLWRWRILENDGVAVQVALRVEVHDAVRHADHPFRQKFPGLGFVACRAHVCGNS